MAVAATGFFDGVHLGHASVIGTLVRTARERGDRSLVLTLWPHPRTVLQDDARSLRLLTTLQEKKDLLLGMGVDEVAVLPFTRDFASMSAGAYLDLLKTSYGVSELVLGYDNRLGSDSLLPDALAPLAASKGLGTVVVPASEQGSGAVSSTRIRAALEQGDVGAAAEMLGRPYMLHGVVVAGNRLGRTIGFPTANMQMYEPLKLVPGPGSYLVEVCAPGGKFYGMTNIGVRPTVGRDTAVTVETNIFDFSEDIYGLDISIKFLAAIRKERRFESLDALKVQLDADRQFCLDLISEARR